VHFVATAHLPGKGIEFIQNGKSSRNQSTLHVSTKNIIEGG
jgi:hypothetical protein